MEPSRFRPSPRGQEREACKPACFRRGSQARVVKGSLPRSAVKEPSPGFPNPIFRPSNADGDQPDGSGSAMVTAISLWGNLWHEETKSGGNQ